MPTTELLKPWLEKELVEAKAATKEYKSKFVASQKEFADTKALIEEVKSEFPTTAIYNRPDMPNAHIGQITSSEDTSEDSSERTEDTSSDSE